MESPSSAHEERPVRAPDVPVLYRLHGPWLVREMTRRTGDRSLAEDLVQDTFVQVFLHHDPVVFGPNIRWWLLRVARNRMMHSVRSIRRGRHLLEEFSNVPLPLASSPLDGLEQRERATRIQRCLEEVPSIHREVLTLFTQSDLTGAEIAQCLGIPIATVWTRLSRGRKAFHAAWEATNPQ